MVRPEITGRDVGQPLVASPNQAMTALGIGRAKLYEKINAGELESHVDGGSRKILWDSIHAFIKQRLAAESARRGCDNPDREYTAFPEISPVLEGMRSIVDALGGANPTRL
jgi:predicted DNA-binding transcriptional regulator AlpA